MIMTSTLPTKLIPSIKDIFPDAQQKRQEDIAIQGKGDSASHQQGQSQVPEKQVDAQVRPTRAESFPGSEQQQSQLLSSSSFGSPDTNKSHFSSDPPRDPPRKRSKISRACDACRRKKIKCNAEYSTTLNKVTQICNNCQKNGDECTFSRTPLKRGPSKGYLKEYEDKDEESGGHGYTVAHLNANLNGNVAQPQPINVFNPNSQIDHRQSQPQQVPQQQQQQQFPQNSLPFPQIRPNSQQMSTIKLPPIIGYNQKPTSPAIHKVITANLNDSSPSNTPLQLNNQPLNNSNNNSPPIQGPFWKVPYEMPRATGPHRSSISSVTSGGGTSRRRSSIDSISSTSTTNTKLPILRHANNSEFLSDSESEDFYSVRSSSSHRPPIMRTNSQSISPRNSVTSLSSLSGRINKSMVLQGGGPISPMTVSKVGTPYSGFMGQDMAKSQLQLQLQLQVPPTNGFNQMQSSPMDMLKADLEVYDKVFASAYPVIPIEVDKLILLIQAIGNEAPTENLVECFHISVNDLVNFKTVSDYTTISMFFKLQQLYQQSRINKVSTLLYALTLVILNYSLLLKGTHYLLGVATAASFLNDLNAVDRIFDEKLNDKPFDMWFAKLYLTLDIIDNIACLKTGVQKTVAGGNLPLFVEKYISVLSEFVYEVYTVTTCLFKMRNNLLVSIKDGFNKPEAKDDFVAHFVVLLQRKYELFELVNNNESDKLATTLETLTTTILNFANYLSTTTMSNKQVLNPCLNLSVDQLFYTIKLVKIIADNTTEDASKINSNLSISYNLLNLNLTNLQLNEQTVRQIKQKITDNPLDFATKAGPNPDWINAVIPMIKSDLMR